MNGLAVALIFAASGVETTWETTPQGDHIYVVQLDDQAIEALRAGHPITSVIPGGLDRVGAVRLQYGSQELRKPALIADSSTQPEVAQVANVASLAMLQQVDPSQSPPNLLSPSAAFTRSSQPSSFQAPGGSAAPTTVDRGVPMQPTFAGGGPSPLPDRDSLPIRVSPEAREWSDITYYATSPLVQGFDYQTGSSRPATQPPVNNGNTGGWTSQTNAQTNAGGFQPVVGATQWDQSRPTNSLDPSGNYPRAPLGNSTQIPFASGQLPAQPTGSAVQLGLNGQAFNPNEQPRGTLAPPPTPGSMFPSYNPANYAGTTNYSPAANGNPGVVPPLYSNQYPSQNTGGTTNWNQTPTSPVINPGWWVNTQGSDASGNAGQIVADNLTRTSYTPPSSTGSGTGSTRLTNRSTQLGTDSTSSRSNNSDSGRTVTAPTDPETREPKDASVAALGLLFLSIGLNVYFGYLIRGFYLKTRQLARDLRESIITT